MTPESGAVQYAYNGDGTLASKTDALGQLTRYTYDGLARPMQIDYYPAGSGQPDACQRVNYYYTTPYLSEFGTDPASRGRVTRVEWSGQNCQYLFDEDYTYTSAGQVFRQRLTMTNRFGGSV